MYAGMDRKNRAEYRMYVVSPIHSIMAVTFSLWGMVFVCGENVNVFTDFECFNTPRMIHMWALMHSSGYFFIDLIVLSYFYRGTTTLDI